MVGFMSPRRLGLTGRAGLLFSRVRSQTEIAKLDNYSGNSRVSESGAPGRAAREPGVELNLSWGEEERASKGGGRLGVLIPSALRAVTPRVGVLFAVLPPVLRLGVPATEGVLGRNRGAAFWGRSLLRSPSIGASESGKSTAGGEDIGKAQDQRGIAVKVGSRPPKM
jgi:hypothetical protein